MVTSWSQIIVNACRKFAMWFFAFFKKLLYHLGTQAATDIWLTTVWSLPLVGISPVRFTGRIAFAKIGGVHSDSWAPLLFSRVREFQSVNVYKLHLTLRRFSLLKWDRHTRPYLAEIMNLSLSPSSVCGSRCRASLTQSSTRKNDRSGPFCVIRLDYSCFKHRYYRHCSHSYRCKAFPLRCAVNWTYLVGH